MSVLTKGNLSSILLSYQILFSRSSASSPEPDNNNQDFAPQKTKGLDPRFLPDPGCPVDLRFALFSLNTLLYRMSQISSHYYD